VDRVVLDASALLAMTNGEPGGDRVAALLLNPDQTVWISTLNWSEVFDRLLRNGLPAESIERLLGRLGLEVVDFDQAQAKLAAEHRIVAPALSLGDRACLALAARLKATVWTTDKAWARVKVGVPVEILR
jgi:PIN domain nuclease of toxin-antitoxin system